MNRKIIKIAAALGIFLLLLAGFAFYLGSQKIQEKEAEEAREALAAREAELQAREEELEKALDRQEEQPEPTEAPRETEAPRMEETPAATPTPAPRLTELEKMLSDAAASYEGDWSIYVKELTRGEEIVINNHPQKAASLIKLYIMGAVYDAYEKETLEPTEETGRLLEQMITVSDNESSNELVRRLSPAGDDHPAGMQVVNAFAQAGGFADTSQGRDLQDVRTTPPPGENYTSVEDCGRFLEAVYQGNCVSAEASAQMLRLLKGQQRTWKIPAGLPEGVESANKTGELSDTENDVAIVYGPQTAYVLCVMAQEVPDTAKAQERIRNISTVVYEYLNTQEEEE